MRKPVLTLLGVAAFAVAGCGGDDDDNKSSSGSAAPNTTTQADTEPLSKTEYIKRADAICAQTKKDTKQFEARTDALPEDAEIDAVVPILEDGVPVLEEGLDKVKALPAPEEDRATLDAYLAAREKTLEVANELIGFAKAKDEQGAQKLIADNDNLEEDTERLGKKYGFTTCANPD